MGFFGNSAWEKQARPLDLIPECGRCGLHKHCVTPFMKVSGKGKRKVLIITEYPGEHEDEQGIQLIGNAGQACIQILQKIGVNMRVDCWLTNAVICRPSAGGMNRKPKNDEIAWCRPNLSKTLKLLQPDVVIPMGEVALKSLIPLAWKDGEVSDVGSWVDWVIPSMKLNTWICPTYHPSFLAREDGRKQNTAIELHMLKHLKNAFAISGKPWPDGSPSLKDLVLVEMNADKAAVYVRDMIGDIPVAFDFETNCLKPDAKYAEILCCAVSNGSFTVAFPWTGDAVTATRELIQSTTPKIAANIQFEERWCRAKLRTAVRNWYWDTVLGAHWLRCHRDICSLKFQAFVLFGMEDYDGHLEPYKKGTTKGGKGGNSINRLKEIEPRVLLEYCGLDALLEVMVAEEQRKVIEWA